MSGFLAAPVVVGVAMAVVGTFGATGRLRYGHWAGLRLPSTLRSRRAWEAAHRAGAAWLLVGGAAGVAAGFLLARGRASALGGDARLVVLAEGGFTLVATLLARRAARAAEPPDIAPPGDPPDAAPPS